jgi:hypothetical protein
MMKEMHWRETDIQNICTKKSVRNSRRRNYNRKTKSRGAVIIIKTINNAVIDDWANI